MNMLLLVSIIAVCVANTILGLIVYLNSPQKVSSRYFALMCLSLSLWAGFNYLADYQLSHTLLWTRLTFFTMSFAITFLILFLNSFPQKIFKSKLLWPIALMVALIVALISLTPQFIPSVSVVGTVSNVQTGSMYPVFILYLGAFFVALVYLIIASWMKSNSEDKARLRYLIFGIIALAVLVTVTNFFLPLVLGSNNLAKYGSLFTLIFVGATAYAIIRHSLFDLRLVVARSFTYALTIITIGLIYGLLAFGVIGRYLFAASINQITFSQQIINTALAVLLAFSFQPIRRFFQKVTDTVFYRYKYDSQKLLNDISLILASEIEVNKLASKVCHELINKMHLQSAGAIVLDRGKIIYESKIPASALDTDMKILRKLGNNLSYIDQLKDGKKKQILKTLGARVSVALKTNNQFIGYLLLGDKKSGEIFNSSDLNTIKIVAGEFSIALENSIAFSEIQQFNKTLQDKIQKATSNLRKANDQLKELDTAKDEFISLAGHQLRTPLTTVKGYVSMLNDGDFGKLTPQQKKSIELALDGSNRMARLIDDLLNASRIEAGKFFIDASSVDLNRIVPEEIELLKTLIKSKGVSLKYNKPTSPVPLLKLDDNKTRQAIMNLAENAVQYTADKNGLVEISLSEKAGKVFFTVKDNGIGVPKDQQTKLFTKMFRASNAREIRPDGTGLGLFLVKRVIEDQGGSIIFESKPGKGSTFGFAIPIHNNIHVDNSARHKLIAQKI